jgi:hypothetical protein
MTTALKMAASGHLTSDACCNAANLALITPYPTGGEARRLRQDFHWQAAPEEDQVNAWFDALFGPPEAMNAAAKTGGQSAQIAAGTVTVAVIQKGLQTPTSDLSSIDYWKARLTSDGVKQFVAGGIAGGVSRTVVSPLERMKILFQVQGPEPAQYRGIMGTLAKIWREEGLVGYMRGNGTNVIRIVPYSAVQFAAYEQFKQVRIRIFLCKAQPSGRESKANCWLFSCLWNAEKPS